MSHLADLAASLSTTDRTLRRAANEGLIRVHRESDRRQRVPLAEQRYLQTHWPLLRDLRAALRTERSVLMAVLFGSTARGDDDPASDVDIAVDLREGDAADLSELEARLRMRTGRRIDLFAVADVRRHPVLWSEIRLHGRTLVDRVDEWPGMSANTSEFVARTDRELRKRGVQALERIRAL